MIEEIKKYFWHYFILLLVLAIGLFGYLFFQTAVKMQILTVIGTSTAYFFWGILHHRLEDDLHLRVVLEYFIIAALADVILIFLLLRA